ncbi:MAG: hypothetical protein AAGM38_01635 [Pseudomonadota bacterium]
MVFELFELRAALRRRQWQRAGWPMKAHRRRRRQPPSGSGHLDGGAGLIAEIHVNGVAVMADPGCDRPAHAARFRARGDHSSGIPERDIRRSLAGRLKVSMR